MTDTPMTDADREWLMREYDKAPPLAPVTKAQITVATARHHHPLPTSIRQQLARDGRERERLAVELGSVRQELAMLKAELDTTRKLDEITARLDRVEASRTGLRTVG